MSEESLVEAQCSVFMRILPSNEIGTLSKDNFKTYNAFSRDDEESDIQTDARDTSVIEKKFFLKSNYDANDETYFELTKPKQNHMVCLKKVGDVKVEVPVEYIIQNTRNKIPYGATISYSVISNKFKIEDVEGEDNKEDEFKMGEVGKHVVKIELPSRLMNELDRNSEESNDDEAGEDIKNYAEGSLKGLEQSPKLTLNYLLKYESREERTEKEEDEKGLKPRQKRGSVDFYISLKGDCRIDDGNHDENSIIA